MMAEPPKSITINVRANVDSEALRNDITDLLVRYTEWLHREGELAYLRPEGPNRSFFTLVGDFFAEEVDE